MRPCEAGRVIAARDLCACGQDAIDVLRVASDDGLLLIPVCADCIEVGDAELLLPLSVVGRLPQCRPATIHSSCRCRSAIRATSMRSGRRRDQVGPVAYGVDWHQMPTPAGRGWARG
jgi:hypothetical protein